MNKNFRQFLEGKYLEWQQREGGRKTVFEFAEWLGVSQSAVSNWWNEGRMPQGDSIRKLAAKLGLEVYDVLGSIIHQNGCFVADSIILLRFDQRSPFPFTTQTSDAIQL